MIKTPWAAALAWLAAAIAALVLAWLAPSDTFIERQFAPAARR